jgi:Ion transport protein
MQGKYACMMDTRHDREQQADTSAQQADDSSWPSSQCQSQNHVGTDSRRLQPSNCSVSAMAAWSGEMRPSHLFTNNTCRPNSSSGTSFDRTGNLQPSSPCCQAMQPYVTRLDMTWDRATCCSVGNPCAEAVEKVVPAPEGDAPPVRDDRHQSDDSSNEHGDDDANLITRLRFWLCPPNAPYLELCEHLAPRSLWFLSLDNSFRRWCIHLVKGRPFERLTLLVILVNCIFLAMDSNDPDFGGTSRGQALSAAEYFFVVIFTVEMLLKVAALGLYEAKGSYLRDPWNIADCLVVIMGWVSLSPSINNISAMRTVRVLRPLRTITGVEGMRMLVSTLLSSLPMLLDVLILCAFLFLILGTVGVQTFAGSLRTSCGIPNTLESVRTGTTLMNVSSFDVIAPTYDPYASCGNGIIKLPVTGGWFALNGAQCAPAWNDMINHANLTWASSCC